MLGDIYTMSTCSKDEEGMMDGFGLGLRTELIPQLFETTRAIDWLEIVADHWVDIGGQKRRQLEQCRERWPVVPHTVSMSIGFLKCAFSFFAPF